MAKTPNKKKGKGFFGRKKKENTEDSRAFQSDIEADDNTEEAVTYGYQSVMPRSRAKINQRYAILTTIIALAAMGYMGVLANSNATLAEKQIRHSVAVVQIEPETNAVVTMRQVEDTDIQANAIRHFVPYWLRVERTILADYTAQEARWRSNLTDECASPLFWLTGEELFTPLLKRVNGEFNALKEEYGEKATRSVIIGENLPQSLGDNWYALDFIEVTKDSGGKEIMRKPRRAQMQVEFVKEMDGPNCAFDINTVGIKIINASINNV